MSSHIYWHLVPFHSSAKFAPTYTLSTLQIVAGNDRLLLHDGGPLQGMQLSLLPLGTTSSLHVG
jgi:hypothetical protein